MSIKIYTIMILAAKSDGEVTSEEKDFIKHLRKVYPIFSKIQQQESSEALSLLKEKTQEEILDQFNSEMSPDEKDIAFAFAMEVCAMNFEMPDTENTFIESLGAKFGIAKKTKEALIKSRKLRYGI